MGAGGGGVRLLAEGPYFCPDGELHTNIEVRLECQPQQPRRSDWNGRECSLPVEGTDMVARPKTGAECHGKCGEQ